VTSVTAGTSDTYTMVVSNSGPSDAANLSVADTLPIQGFTNITSPNLPSGVTFTAATDSWTLASLASGQSVTLQLAGIVPSGATGSTYVNTASASATDAATVTASDSDTLTTQAALTITKTDGVSSVVVGSPDTYTIVVSNSGPSDAANLSVVDTLPIQGFTNITSPNLPSGVTFTSATDTWTLASLASGQSVTLQLAGIVPSGATGPTYVNTASASATDAATVTASDSDTLTAHATLAIIKTDNDGGSSLTPTVGSAVPGNSITYTIVASNSGPSTATGVTVADPLAANASITTDSWTATGSGGATGFSAIGSGSINDSSTIPAGGSVTYTVAAAIRSSATGTLVNTASASASDASTVTATDSDTLSPHATLALTKTDSDQGSSVTSAVGTAVPGTSITYTIVASNSGPSTATGVTVADPLASNTVIGSDSWTASGSGGATGFSATGSGSINDSSTIPVGGTVTYTVTATIRSSATGTLANTATASASDATTVSATDTDTLSGNATLGITKTDNDGGSSITSTVGSAVPGTSITYTVVASNSGPSTATGVTVTDPLALNPAIASDTWTATGSGGTTGFSASGSGSISDSPTIPAGGAVTYVVSATIRSSATGTLVNTATASASDAATVTATDSDSLTAHATLGITKTDGVTSVTAGATDTYTIVVSNSGPSDAANLNVADTLPAQGFTNITSPNLPSGVTFTAATDSWPLASLPSGQSVTLQLAGTVPSGATGSSYVNTATASASDASTVTATDSDSLTSHATLAITKTDGVTSVTAGAGDTYTIVVSNSGPSDASNLSVADTLPAQGFTNISSPNLPSGVTFTAATDTWTLTSLPSGQSVTLQLAGTVPSSATGSTYVNSASASASDAATVTASDSDTLNTHATLAITNSDGITSVGVGGPDTYTIVVSNSGPSDASNLSVVDTLPAQGFTNVSSPNLPSGVIFTAATDSWTLASLAAAQSVTLQLLGTVPSTATGSTYVNTASASASDASTVTATDSDSLTAQADLTVTKTDSDGGSSVTSAVGTAAPGTQITYTVVAANAGPSTVTGAEIYDPVAVIHSLSSDTWTGSGSGGATGFTSSGSGSIDDIITIPPGGSVTYTVVATIKSSATGTLSNTVTVTPPSGFTNTNPLATAGGAVSATDSDTLAQANLTITDTDGVSSVGAGGSDTYTIVVTNTGPSIAPNLTVVDTLPTQGLTNISSPNLPSGVTFTSATDTWSLASLAVSQSVTLQLSGTVPPGATGSTYTNGATASASDASAVSATDTDTLGNQGDVTLTLTDNDGGSSITPTTGTAVAGSTITYTIVAANTGPSTVSGAETYNPLSVIRSIGSDTWTATGSGGATGFTPSGSGSIDDIITIPAGGSVTYTVVAVIKSSASGTLSNTVTLTPPANFTNTNPLATAGGAVSATDSDTITSS
jgi:uncharacterized repeat protein (TIGR01451 family)